MWVSTARDRTQPTIVERSTDTLPQSTLGSLFVVSGKILLTNIVGEVTTAIQNQANLAKLVSNPTVGADVNLCQTLNISNDTVGTMYNITGTLSHDMIATTSGAVESQGGMIVVSDGTIDLDCSASSTGSVQWTLHYSPLDSDSSVTTI